MGEQATRLKLPARVIDTNVMITANLLQLSLECRLVTTPEAMAQVLDPATKAKIESLPFPIATDRPSKLFLQNVRDFAKSTGDEGSLSDIDIGLIALAAKMMVREGGKDRLNKKPLKPITGVEEGQSQSEEDSDSAQESQRPDSELDQPQPEQDSEELGRDQGEWVTAQSWSKRKAELCSQLPTEEDQKMPALITQDFAMQNVSLLIGVPVITPGNRRITELRRYVVQCYACFQLVQDGNLSINRVCPGCGYLTLSKISCTVMANGKVVLHKKKHWRPARGVQQKKQREAEEEGKKRRRNKGYRKKRPTQGLHFL